MACFAGGLTYFLLRQLNVDADLVTIGCILLIVLIRIIAVRYRISLPLFYLSRHGSGSAGQDQ